MKRDSAPLFIEVDQVKFAKTPDTAIEFSNEIDVWSRMQFQFSSQIKELRVSGDQLPTKKPDRKKKDLATLVYSIRQRLD
ncbi:MAG: hypothetical protein K2P81_09640 [Bacteriovoracaceae bacterium]|nr:hypothetical protein [Bacteriovoracaceae bacterium]